MCVIERETASNYNMPVFIFIFSAINGVRVSENLFKVPPGADGSHLCGIWKHNRLPRGHMTASGERLEGHGLCSGALSRERLHLFLKCQRDVGSAGQTGGCADAAQPAAFCPVRR